MTKNKITPILFQFLQIFNFKMSPIPPPSSQPLPSLQQIRESIPKHCFERSLAKSLLFAGRDVLMMGVLAYLAAKFIGFQINLLTLALWAVYAYIQGTIGFGLFVVGHQCGHGAFSNNQLINDIVGFVLHSSILVPYFSWQRSHYVHHSKNCHLQDNESHQPSLITKSRNQYQTTYKLFGYNGFIILELMIHSAPGWLIYLFFHGTGSRRNPFTKQQYKSIPNHFSPFPSNQLFPPQLRFKIGLSTAGVVAVLATLIALSWNYGFLQVGLLYTGPYIVTFGWLVVVTWLQHTEPTVPHYGDDQWHWLKGALMTVDRNYPTWIDQIQHHIGTTHVLHHIFPQIPHYNAVQATKAIIPVLGPHYRYDSTPITSVMWRLASKCHYVESLEGVQFYKSFTDQKRKQENKKN